MNQSILMAAVYFMPILAVAQTVSYCRLRYSNAFANEPDPHLGRKFALHAVFNTCIMMILIGVSILGGDAGARWAEVAEATDEAAVAAARAKPFWSKEVRGGAGLAISGIAHGAILAAVLGLFTNDRRVPTVRRAMYGLRLFLSMIVLLGMNTYTILYSIDVGPVPLNRIAPALPISLVWGLSVIIHGVLLFRRKPGDAPPKEPDTPPV
jgi:hypothetical protein